MHWTRTDAARRWVVVIGLITGPVLLSLSNAFDIQGADDSLRAGFEAMTANPDLLIVQSLLEALGFTIVLSSYAGATHALRARGGALGTWGAVLCVVGILGFGFSTANGLTFHALAQMPNHETGLAAATAIVGDSLTGMITMIPMLTGQLGIILVISGLMRTRIVPIWPLLLVIVGILVNAAFGLTVTTFIADLLLLAASVWIAIALTRSERTVWLGAPTVASAQHTTVTI